jgi:hypothetical protein
MSHIAAPQGNSVTQMNTNATRQIAGAVNTDSPGATSIATIVSALIVLNPEARKRPICAYECWV